MKTRMILLAAVAAMLSVSCAKVSDVTKISGEVNLEEVYEVNIVIEGVVDTLVPVVDGKFVAEVPTDIAKSGLISAANTVVNFIPDGTPLKVVLDEESTVVSRYPEISVQAKVSAYLGEISVLMDELRAEQQEIAADSTYTEVDKANLYAELFSNFLEKYFAYNQETCRANTDNYISVIALSNLRGQLDDETMRGLVDLLSPALLEDPLVKSMDDALKARQITCPGSKFQDFTINSVVGQTRSIPPQPVYSEVKLSDYVGKGKYVLVEFWAPWCTPCKKETPNLKSVYKKFKGNNFDVLSIAIWEREPVEVTIKTAAELGKTWPQINNGGREPAEIYGIETIPHMILFGPDGTILNRNFYGDDIENTVDQYL